MGTLLLIRHGQASYGEVDYDRLHEVQTRVIGVLDLAFTPEP